MKDRLLNGLKKHGISILIFLALALVFSYPALQGNVLSTHDNASWKAMSSEARVAYEESGETQLWTNSMFGGMLTYLSYLTGVPNAMMSVQSLVQDILPKPAYFLFFAMLGFYILLIALGVKRWIAAIGAVTYAFASYNLQIIAAGHETKMLSIAFMPIALAGMIRLYRGQYFLGGALALAGIALTLQNGMYQIVYYLLLIMLAMGIAYFIKAIKEGKWKNFIKASVIMIFCGLLSLAPSLMQVSLVAEYNEYTMRGGNSELTMLNKEKKPQGGLDKDYAFSWSQGIGETFTLFVPNLYGGASQTKLGEGSNTYEVIAASYGEQNAEQFAANTPLYWGPQPSLAGPFYLGIITMLLMCLGLLLIKNRMKWVLLAIGIVGIMMSWGDHFQILNYALFDYLPKYNSFRSPNMCMVIPSLTFGMLAFMGLQEFLYGAHSKDELWDKLKKAVIIVGGLTLLFGVGGRMFLDFRGENDTQLKEQYAQSFQNEQKANEVYNAIVADRGSAATKDAMRSLFFLLAAGLLLWLYSQKKLDQKKTVVLMAVLFLLDIVLIGNRYLNEGKYQEEDLYEAQFAPRAIDNLIKQDPDPYYRVLDLSVNTYNDAIGAVHHKMVGGYHPAKMESYEDLLSVHLRGGLNESVLRMLNTKYIIAPQSPDQPIRVEACGNAWFVDSITLVNTADEEMLALNGPKLGDSARSANAWDPLNRAVMRKALLGKMPSKYVKGEDAQIKLTKYGLNELNYTSANANDGYAVFSDIYYDKGWKAYIDNKEVPIVKTNYLLRGLFIPAGNHKIDFKFQPATFAKYKGITTISSYLIIALILLGLGMFIKDGSKQSEVVEEKNAEIPEVQEELKDKAKVLENKSKANPKIQDKPISKKRSSKKRKKK